MLTMPGDAARLPHVAPRGCAHLAVEFGVPAPTIVKFRRRCIAEELTIPIAGRQEAKKKVCHWAKFGES